MRPERRRLAVLASVTTIGLVVALGVRPVSTDRILAAYVLALAAIALLSLTRVLRSVSEWDEPSQFAQALQRRAAARDMPPELVRIEREITLGVANAGQLHARLLPSLREAAAARLSAKHRVELDRRPDTARALLGDPAWELLRPDLAPPADRSAPGLPLRRVRELVDVLERL